MFRVRNFVCCRSEYKWSLFWTGLQKRFNRPCLSGEIRPFALRSRQDNLLFSYKVVCNGLLKSSALKLCPDTSLYSFTVNYCKAWTFVNQNPCIISSIHICFFKQRKNKNNLFPMLVYFSEQPRLWIGCQNIGFVQNCRCVYFYTSSVLTWRRGRVEISC